MSGRSPGAQRWGSNTARVDPGESNPLANDTPILRPGGEFPAAKVRAEFQQRSKLIDRDIRAVVLERVAQFGGLIDDDHD